MLRRLIVASLLIVVCAAAQPLLPRWLSPWGIQPALLIGLVVAIGVRWGSPAGMAAGLAEGWLQGSLAGRSLALLALVGIAVGFMAGRFDARIFRPSWLGVSLAAGVFSLLTQLALGPPSPPAGDFSPGWWLPVLLVFGSSLYTALVSPGLDLLIRKWGGE